MGIVLLGADVSQAAETKVQGFDPYATVPLGKTGLQVSRLCLGTGAKGNMRQSNHTRLGKVKFEALLRDAHQRGVTFFDLADMYGTHPYVFSALKGIPRHQIQVTTKIWFRNGGIPEKERPDADVVVQRFLKELGTDHIDLLLLHCMTSPTWPEEMKRQMDILSDLKQKGLIRAHGVSCHSLPALEAAAKSPWVDSVHARINPYGMSMDAAPEMVVPVLKQIHEAGKGVVGMKIVGEGKLRDQPEKLSESIRFSLHLGCVDVLNVGCESIQELDDLSTRIRAVPVPA